MELRKYLCSNTAIMRKGGCSESLVILPSNLNLPHGIIPKRSRSLLPWIKHRKVKSLPKWPEPIRNTHSEIVSSTFPLIRMEPIFVLRPHIIRIQEITAATDGKKQKVFQTEIGLRINMTPRDVKLSKSHRGRMRLSIPRRPKPKLNTRAFLRMIPGIS